MDTYLYRVQQETGIFGGEFQAESWEEAETICERNGWQLDGKLFDRIDATTTTAEAMDALIASMNENKPH
jgi:hypothetical protein